MPFLPLLRLLHVFFGVFWVGAVIFQVLILEPRLRALGPQIQQPVMKAITPLVAPAMILSSLTVFTTGTFMTLALRAGRLDTLFTTGWGMTIMVGIVATALALVVGLGGLTPTGIRLARMSDQLNGQPPSPAQAATLSQLGHRMEVLHRADLALVLIALITMPLARFI
jgi:hypothetical protein